MSLAVKKDSIRRSAFLTNFGPSNFVTALVVLDLNITKSKYVNVITLLVSRSEYPRDKPFLLTMVSYLKNKIKIKI